jgi:hypothetical protein
MAAPVSLTTANSVYRTGDYAMASNLWGTPQNMLNQRGPRPS